MTGKNVKASTVKREAYFLEYAEKIRETVRTPLMVTGGFRSVTAMETALSSRATDLIGIARPLALKPDLSHDLLNGALQEYRFGRRLTGIKAIDDMAMMETVWYTRQLERIAEGKAPKPNENPFFVFLRQMSVSSLRGFKLARVRA